MQLIAVFQLPNDDGQAPTTVKGKLPRRDRRLGLRQLVAEPPEPVTLETAGGCAMAAHPRSARVLQPGLASCPEHALTARQMTGF
ncbi:hypothetical protein [Thiohalocapsa halophila]|jgi:hypothetical protein